jgi:hypothetical protein
MPRGWTFAILATLLVLTLSADTIELKTGERIDGVFKQATSAGAVMDVAGQPITIPLEKVKTIYFGAAPSPTATGPSLFQESMDTLKALRSITTTGISYRDYVPRVLDARVKVDRYLSSAMKEPAQKAVGLAMRYYELAREPLLNGILNDVGNIIAGDPSLQVCTALKAAAVSMKADRNGKQGLNSTGSVMLYVGEHPAVLWTCASEQIAEAERLAAQQ